MKKIQRFQITQMTISGFKSYQEPTTIAFGGLTTITGGNGKGKTSIADAIAFVITGLPFFGKRGIDKLHNESNPDVTIALSFLDEEGAHHELTRTRRSDRMTITFDGYEIRQIDLTELFGERDVFLSIFNPLYFIEELGDNGKNLLERYMPMISHGDVLAQLPERTRAALKDESLLSPEVYLKKRREDIRSLEESIIYLTGQKDLASTQGQDREKAAEELTQRLRALQEELAVLEKKRFAGMDVPDMQERLVELSARYGELAKDGCTDADSRRAQIHALREKMARRQGEAYQSQFAQALAEAQARVNDLGARYSREVNAYKALTPGASCPTCHRPVTAENLSEVQAAVKAAADAIVKAGKEQQAVLQELQETERKAREVFERFKAEDLEKWEAEIAALESERQEAPGDQLDSLRMEIQALTSDLEYGALSPEEYDRMKVCREEYRRCEAEQAALQTVTTKDLPDFDQQIAQAKTKIGELKRRIADVVLYVSKRVELTFSELKMNKVAISLYDVVKSTGEVKDAFKFTYGGRNYDRLSLSEKIRAGMEVSEMMKRLTGRNYPVFIDNMESVDDLNNVRPTGQIIMARCIRGAELSVQSAGQPELRQAA